MPSFLGLFSVVFYVGFATVLAPSFDIGAELSSEQVAELAYHGAVDRIGFALLGANVVTIGIGLFAWILAARTLKPFGEAHPRQRRFVADASHEMRTPLATILSSAEGALAVATTTDELRKALAVNAHAARRLTRLTTDLLTLARAGEPSSGRRERIDTSVVVAEAVEAFVAAHPEHPPSRLSLGADLLVHAVRVRSAES